MQEFMDSLSQVPGSILYRDRIQWKGLSPGTPGQVLTWTEENGLHWADSTGTGGDAEPQTPIEAYSVSPESGTSAGGTVITITGANFDDTLDTSVEIGTAEAIDATVIDAETIEATTPAGTGLNALTVINGLSSAYLPAAFNYVAPTANPSHSFTDPGSRSFTATRVGYRFTVGAQDLSVTDLEVYGDRSGDLEWVKIHRWSDGVEITAAQITAVADEWIQVSVTPVTLAANTDYVISTQPVTTTNRPRNYNAPDLAYAPEITHVANLSQQTHTMPTVTTANNEQMARFLFLPA